MRVLAVDFGEKRVGLAVSDETGSLVVPVGALIRKNDAQVASAIAEAAREREVERIVVGHPVRPDGSEGTSGIRTRLFARRLGEVSGLPVELHGEGLTTVAAEENLREAGLPLRGFRGVLDSTVPVGSGLSSSAALEMASSWALAEPSAERPSASRHSGIRPLALGCQGFVGRWLVATRSSSLRRLLWL